MISFKNLLSHFWKRMTKTNVKKGVLGSLFQLYKRTISKQTYERTGELGTMIEWLTEARNEPTEAHTAFSGSTSELFLLPAFSSFLWNKIWLEERVCRENCLERGANCITVHTMPGFWGARFIERSGFLNGEVHNPKSSNFKFISITSAIAFERDWSLNAKIHSVIQSSKTQMLLDNLSHISWTLGMLSQTKWVVTPNR